MYSELSLQLNVFFLNGGTQGVSEGKEYTAVGIVLPIVCSLIDRATAYTKSSKLTSVYVIYSLFKNMFTSSMCRRWWTYKELNALDEDMYQYREGRRTILFRAHIRRIQNEISLAGSFSTGCKKPWRHISSG